MDHFLTVVDKQPDFDIEFFSPFQQRVGGTGKKLIQQRPVKIKRRPEFIGHGEGDVLPFAVRQDVLLLCYPLLGGFHAAGAAAFAFAALTEIFGVCAVSRLTAITANTHGSGAAGKHALNDQFGPFGDSMTTIDEKAVPVVINLKEKLCGSGNIHARNYSGRRLLRTAIDLPCLSSAAGGYCSEVSISPLFRWPNLLNHYRNIICDR